ncbi:MAG TPA: aldehyde dehydrogenase family protein, partial [Candidatus Nitrosotenuis sp.]|nr:aldehyde dehydrogenase family protein [Candidatus Nitrosotenuis sp.]
MAEVAVKSYGMFIGGQWRPAADGQTEPVLNPANEEVLAHVARGSEEDVNRAVEAACAAFEGWAETPPAERAAALLKLADI